MAVMLAAVSILSDSSCVDLQVKEPGEICSRGEHAACQQQGSIRGSITLLLLLFAFCVHENEGTVESLYRL